MKVSLSMCPILTVLLPNWAYQTYLPYHCMVLTHTLDELLASMSLVDSILFFFFFHFALLGFCCTLLNLSSSVGRFPLVAKAHVDICGSDCFVMILFLFDIRN